MSVSEFAGSLRERITLWEGEPLRLPNGASRAEMRKVMSCLACIVSEGAASAHEAGSVSAMPRFRVTLRADDRVAIDQQVRWRGRAMIVRALLADPASPDRLVLQCEEQRA